MLLAVSLCFICTWICFGDITSATENSDDVFVIFKWPNGSTVCVSPAVVPMLVISARSAVQCTATCLQKGQTACRQVNYWSDTKQCQLYSPSIFTYQHLPGCTDYIRQSALCTTVPYVGPSRCPQAFPNATLIMRNNGTVNAFVKSWNAFKVGFGEYGMPGYWIGNDMLNLLTSSRNFSLGIDVQISNGSWYFGVWSSFVVASEAMNYTMNFTSFLTASSSIKNNAIANLNGMKFTSNDRDNDLLAGFNCCTTYGGCFWYRSCANVCLVCKTTSSYYKWQGIMDGSGTYYPLQEVYMWLI